jgi:N-acetyl-gamma-glutamyl-phosphate reductase
MNDSTFTLGIVGARGHTGAELIKLVAATPAPGTGLRVLARARRAAPVRPSPGIPGRPAVREPDADAVAAKGVDAVILALPNGLAAPFVAHWMAKPDTVIVDLSADYRFDNSWYYGLPELTRAATTARSTSATRAAMPRRCSWRCIRCWTCWPARRSASVSPATPVPVPRRRTRTTSNLADNLMPYALTNHVHEREVSVQLGVAVEFMPHVAPHFRGITLTANLWLNRVQTREQIVERFQQAYAGEPLIEVVDEAPWVSRIAGRHGAQVGGFTLAPGGKRVVVVATLDNLLKGAATQAMQNPQPRAGHRRTDVDPALNTPSGAPMADLLWKPGVAVDAQIQTFLAGDDVILDREFFLHDIAASAAHAQGLQHIGILSADELAGAARTGGAGAGLPRRPLRAGYAVRRWSLGNRSAPDRTPRRRRPQDPHRPQPQ